ncbi:ribonuclease H-like domain, reverse transcriptase, RNA-dependent DNA polymerase [Tanacetum coccineum]|uniref:Ribonuclease H-like domain, reverse transcriptase, RNA-dependent DNA polymerase n=1 Tax=Tanacetum coccineum TaxID=301880 RepID=A0ABQ5BLU9_9ASTR
MLTALTEIVLGAYDDEDVGTKADLNNLETTMNVSPIFTTRIHKDDHKNQIIRDINSATQTRRMIKITEEHAMTLVDLPKGKRAIGTKWVYRNKKDKRGIVVRNKARLVTQGYTQEEGIDHDEVFAHVARIEAIRLFLAYASFMGLIVYQMDVKSAFLYGTNEEEKEDGIFISQVKYVADILKKFDLVIVKAASSPIETNKALLKDKEAEDVDVHLYRSIIGSLMYLTASRPEKMFDVCACARFQVTLKTSHLHAVKRIFRYLKGHLKLGLWYPRDSPFDLETFYDSDYAGAILDMKSTTGAEYVDAANVVGSDEFGVNTGSCKVNAARQDLVLMVLFVTIGDNTAEGVNSKYNGFFASRSDENAEFHQIVDFLTTSFIHYALTQIYATVDGKTVVISKSSVKSDLHFNDEDGITCLSNDEIFVNLALMGGPPKKVGDEAVYIGEDDRVVRAATTTSSLEAEQESDAQTRFKTASKKSHDPPLSEGNIFGSGVDSMEHPVDLMDFVPLTPHDLPLLGSHTLRSDKDCSRLGDLKAEKESQKIGKGTKGKNSKYEALQDWYLQEKRDTLNTASINVSDAGPSHVSTAGPLNVSVVGPSTSTAEDIFEDEMTTIADTLVAIRSARPRTTLVMIHNVKEEPRRATLVPIVQSQDKGKGKMVEPEPTPKNPRKAQIQMDEELAQRLFEEEQTQFEKEQRIAREKATGQEAKDAALIEQMEDVQARMDADELLAERL